VYSFREDTYRGNPILILLKDIEPVFDEAEHIKGLKFGIKKAKMIINTMAQIEVFFNSNGANPPEDFEIYVDQGKYDMPCYCVKRINFRINNFTIDKSFLEIHSNDTKIGFGLVKAEGLIILKGQIEDFIRKNDNRRWL
jgi:hypothetical protein